MRVDLALEHLQLHRGGELALPLHLGCRHLRGKQFAEPLGDRLLRFGDLLRAVIVELQRPLDGVAHRDGNDDGGLDGGGVLGKADVLAAVQHANRPIGDGVVRRLSANVASHGVIRFLKPRVTENLLGVGDGHGDGGGARQEQLADILRRLRGQAILHEVERGAGQLQHGVGLPGAHRIGIHQQTNGQREGKREGKARDDHRDHVDVGRHRRSDEDDGRQGGDGQSQNLHVEETRLLAAPLVHGVYGIDSLLHAAQYIILAKQSRLIDDKQHSRNEQ